jgi:hypothetical protein
MAFFCSFLTQRKHSFWLREEKSSLLLVSRLDQSTEFLLWQRERSGVCSWKGGKWIERNHDPLVGIYFHSRDNKRVHDGRFVEHFNLGRKLSSQQVGEVVRIL